ncbi:MAG: ferrous iron transport protein B [Smithellaceae bacterium]|nr:ferrous iron transport protein B [Smithellaceae bacterium]
MGIFRKRKMAVPGQDDAKGQVRRIVLVGNPNVGKSLIFNALTGAYVTVSNYPGTSVEVSRGMAQLENERCEIIDTPGMYSLMPITEEERVARQILLTGEADVVIHVVDARSLERMLSMTMQLIEAGLPVILVVNIMDEAERLGITIDLPLLQERLGIPVIGATMKRKVGLTEIRKAITSLIRRGNWFTYGRQLEEDIAGLTALLSGSYSLSHRALALLLLQRDSEIAGYVKAGEKERGDEIENYLRERIFQRRGSFNLELSLERRELIATQLTGVIQVSPKGREEFSQRLSHWMMNPWTGVPILLGIIYFGLYQFVGVFGAGELVDLLEGTLFEQYFNPASEKLVKDIIPWPMLQELFVGEYGILTMGLRYAIAIILPIVLTFFLFFSIMEDTGYFPRLAMLLDRLFKLIGLSGRAVIPMVLGFGCDTMATMVTRTLETTRERIIATLLIALAIPCSAQLGVILGLLAPVPGALLIWTGSVGLIFVVVGFLSSRLLPGKPPVFYMEIPPLRLPQLGNVLTKTYSRLQWYLLEILPIFILASVILWLGKITRFFDALIERMSVLMTALGLPAEAAVAFILGFFRRDYGAAGLYDLQAKGLLEPRQLAVAAVTLTLFVPCVAQFLIMLKERGTKVALAILLFVSLTAFFSGYLLNRFLLATGLL